MNIQRVRRISQVFFLALFIWFCIVAAVGKEWWQLRGWPVDLFLQLDPLIALATLLTTGTLYAGLAWSLATIVGTLLWGRFFCGWVCPFGALHHFFGYLGKRGLPAKEKIRLNQYHPGQSIKYAILVFFLMAAAGNALRGLLPGKTPLFSSTLQIGLLDPISLLHRSVMLTLVPLVDETFLKLSSQVKYSRSAWLIGGLLLLFLLLNFKRPRFYCRFLCPLGALLGLLSRWSLWRIGKTESPCPQCMACVKDCEGACTPHDTMRINECVLCMNCLHTCPHDFITYTAAPDIGSETATPDISRRTLVFSGLAGLVTPPLLRLEGYTGPNWNPRLIRPPGALDEDRFLDRCVKCGFCMRVCPTNVIQPALLEAGFQGIWTPVLNFRMGTSGCQLNCVACGHLCPTAAIRPLSLAEKLGRTPDGGSAPVRIGTAFVDRGRCLPWAMDKPCIVCQENCPVSPKAIITRLEFQAVHMEAPLVIQSIMDGGIQLREKRLKPNVFATGDYFTDFPQHSEIPKIRISGNTANEIHLTEPPLSIPDPGERLNILVRLQRPVVDPARCIGCGTCEHECPVAGRRAIRVTGENASRDKTHTFFLS